MDIWITFFPFKETIAGTNLLKEYGPVISSVIAAFSAMGCAFFSCRYQKKMAYSKMVIEQAKDVMAACYRCVSTASVVNEKINLGKDYSQVKEWAEEDIETILKAKDSLRFILSDGSDGLRSLTRIINWIEHKKNNSAIRDDLLNTATKLRISIDDAFIYSINYGKKPSKKLIKEIQKNSQKLYEIHGEKQKNDEITEIEERHDSSTPGA